MEPTTNDLRNGIAAAADGNADGALFGTMAAAAGDLRPAFEVFASEEELADHDRVVGMLWACAAEPTAYSPGELRAAFLRIWPFDDDEPPRDFDDSTPVYDKIETLQALHHFTYRLEPEGLAEAARVGSLTVGDVLEELGSQASRASDEAGEHEISARLEKLGEDEVDFLAAELDVFLRAGGVDVEAARERARQRADAIRNLLPTWWVSDRAWSTDELDRARGVQDTLGVRPPG